MAINPLNIWIIGEGETLPTSPDVKRMRYGMLSAILANAGHEITWWCSTHQHQDKSFYAEKDTEMATPEGTRIKLLHAGGYQKNISLERIRYHQKLANKFAVVAPQERIPDVIVCAYPSIDLAYEATRFAKQNKVPIIIDIRDKWPDSFVDYAPHVLKPAIYLICKWLYIRKVRYTMQHATSVVSMMSSLLDWALAKVKRTRTGQEQVFYLGSDADIPQSPRETKLTHQIIEKAHGRKIYLYLGTFCITNGVHTLADAINQLDDSIFFVLAGNGELMSDVQQKISNNDNVECVGWVGKEDCNDLLSLADAALLPAWNEAMPNKMWDYLTGQLPLISAMAGESRDLIHHHQIGETCAPRDASSLAQAITQMHKTGEQHYANNVQRLPKELYAKGAIYDNFYRYIQTIARTNTL